jgi:hypothetical protein
MHGHYDACKVKVMNEIAQHSLIDLWRLCPMRIIGEHSQRFWWFKTGRQFHSTLQCGNKSFMPRLFKCLHRLQLRQVFVKFSAWYTYRLRGSEVPKKNIKNDNGSQFENQPGRVHSGPLSLGNNMPICAQEIVISGAKGMQNRL